ncbi:MAG: MFS transporter [Dehalococcoidales bacterium]|nr:MFS transporter [Dehalococcoidales bacterium]
MPQEHGPRVPRVPRAILVSTWLISFAMWSPMFCVPPMEHVLKEAFHLSHAQASLLYIAPIIMLAALAVPGGLLADRIGAKKAAGIGAIVMALGTVLRGTATDASGLLAFTFIYGAGMGLSFPNIPKLVSAWFPRKQAGVATGLFTSGLLTGIALAVAITVPFILPLTGTFQGVFFIWSIPPILAAILWWALVREPSPQSTGVRPSGQGSTGTSTPFHRLLCHKRLWLAAGLLWLHNFFFYTWSGWAPTLMMLKGATPELAGVIASVTIWVGIPTSFLAPQLAYRMGLRKPFLWIPGIILALAAWGVIGAGITVSWFLMALVGVAVVTRFVTVLALPVEMMSGENVGRASGLILSLGYTGGIVGSQIGGRILDVTGSLDNALLVLVAVSAAAVFVALGLPETGPKAKKPIPGVD